MKLHEETKKLADKHPAPVSAICADLGIDKSWWYKWRRGEIPDPGVERIQMIHDWLIKFTNAA
jgi:hypothetical protein